MNTYTKHNMRFWRIYIHTQNSRTYIFTVQMGFNIKKYKTVMIILYTPYNITTTYDAFAVDILSFTGKRNRWCRYTSVAIRDEDVK